MKKRVIALVVCFALLLALFVPVTALANENEYVARNVGVSLFGYSHVEIGPYELPDYIDSIAIMFNKQINPNYVIAKTYMLGGLHPLELEFSFEEINGSKYIYWFDMPDNRGYIVFDIVNANSTPINYTVNIVY